MRLRAGFGQIVVSYVRIPLEIARKYSAGTRSIVFPPAAGKLSVAVPVFKVEEACERGCVLIVVAASCRLSVNGSNKVVRINVALIVFSHVPMDVNEAVLAVVVEIVEVLAEVVVV